MLQWATLTMGELWGGVLGGGMWGQVRGYREGFNIKVGICKTIKWTVYSKLMANSSGGCRVF